MPLVHGYESYIFRVDGDVFEVFFRGETRGRVLLAWLAVQVFPVGRGRLGVQIGWSAIPGTPLYEVVPKASVMTGRGTTVAVNISPEEEPVLREFFTQVGQLCGRPVMS